jgi:hypothetical protein
MDHLIVLYLGRTMLSAQNEQRATQHAVVLQLKVVMLLWAKHMCEVLAAGSNANPVFYLN